jgi:uncharacterized SAM-binding protein YcdF (DUF218 family)
MPALLRFARTSARVTVVSSCLVLEKFGRARLQSCRKPGLTIGALAPAARTYRRSSVPNSERGGILGTLLALLFLLLFCAAIYFARQPLLRFAGESWIVDESLDHADAILVLSDDNFYADRVTRAAELFREGRAPIVVASGRRLRPYAGIAELMQHDLLERGVPKEKILAAPYDGQATRDEAQSLAALASQKNWHHLLIVTSNYDTRRARYIFRHIFPPDVELAVVSARDGDFNPEQWWQHRQSFKAFTTEFVGLLVAVWELRSTR